MLIILLLFVHIEGVRGLNNGLALTPPMGWLAWTRFLCETDCVKRPKQCISESLFTSMADIMVGEGYADAGYTHVNVDDCWAMKSRHANGRVVPDKTRFSHGIKWLAQYMHSRGLLLGMYANYGEYTCMGYPGTEVKDMVGDAKQMAEWNVDMLKFDGCFNDPNSLDHAYPVMSEALNKSGKAMIYSCSWPYYVRTKAHKQPNYAAIVKNCNMWRNFDDIQISWGSIQYIIDFYDENQDELAQFHGPGHWNDPDMLIIGNPGLTFDQCKVQMALWAIWSAPLLMSNDLREMMPNTRDILINRKVIGVNQDKLGVFGKKIKQHGSVGTYVKKMTPVIDGHYSYAIVFFNKDPTAYVRGYSWKVGDLGLNNEGGYWMQELFSGKYIPVVVYSEWISQIDIPPTGVIMYKATIFEAIDSNPMNLEKRKSLNWKLIGVFIIVFLVLFAKIRKNFCRFYWRKLNL